MKILGTTKISVEIENILNEADEFLIIVSPYLQINQRLKVRLSDAFKKVKQTIFIYRSNANHSKSSSYRSFDDGVEWLKKFDNITLMGIMNLHSKIYLNQSHCLITSMNLYKHSQINNHEIGVIINKKENVDYYVQVLDEIRVMIESEYPENPLLINIIEKNEDYTMRKLFWSLSSNYRFEGYKNGSPELYQYLCESAMKFVEFSDLELYIDKTAILRSTNLGKDRYNRLKNNLRALAK